MEEKVEQKKDHRVNCEACGQVLNLRILDKNYGHTLVVVCPIESCGKKFETVITRPVAPPPQITPPYIDYEPFAKAIAHARKVFSDLKGSLR